MLWKVDVATLPDGTFVVSSSSPTPALLWRGALWHLVLDDEMYHRASLPSGSVTVLTPAPIVQVLRAGYEPLVRIPAAQH